MSNPNFFLMLLMFALASACQTQNPSFVKYQLVGGPCEGCEAIFEYGNKELNPIDILPDFSEDGMKIKIEGTVYQPDGRTPAKGVVLYVYHTDQTGEYPTSGDETGWARRHGYIRGWMKTEKDGHYEFYTLKPGIYPSRSNPSHIHITILEPSGKYYWIDEFYFEGDPLLTNEQKNPESPRGGDSGLLSLTKMGEIWRAKRDIVLGKNVIPY